MKFDMEAARKICNSIQFNIGDLNEEDDLHIGFGDDPELDFDSEEILLVIQAIRMLPAALDEIKRLRKYCILTPDGKIFVPEGHPELVRLRKENEAQAKRIAELDAKCLSQKREIRVLQENDCKWFQEALSNRLNFNRNAEDLAKRLNKDKIAKQYAALKKLGQAKRERGKALIYERMLRILQDNVILHPSKDDIEEAAVTAKKQFRQEGLL